jgi:hypothetical protein
MDKKFFITTAAVFIVWMLGSFLVHGLWLQPTYDTMTNMMRSAAEQESLMPYMLIAHLLMSGAFVWIYQRGNEDKPWVQQGLRFGIAIALLAPIPTFMIYYVVQQEAASLAVKQSVGDSIVVIIVALVAAFLNRKTT